MASLILFCALCGKGVASLGEIPQPCPSCLKFTKWSTLPPNHAEQSLKLTQNDRRFLKKINIDPE